MDQELDMSSLNERLLVLHIRENAPNWIGGLKDHQRDFETILRGWHEEIYPDRKNFYAVPDMQFFEPAKKFIDYLARSKAFDGIDTLHGLDLATKSHPGHGLDYNPKISGILGDLCEPHGFPVMNAKRVLRGLSIHRSDNGQHPEWLLSTDKLPGMYLPSCLALYKEFDQRRQVEASFERAEQNQKHYNNIINSWNLGEWRDNRQQSAEPHGPAPGSSGP